MTLLPNPGTPPHRVQAVEVEMRVAPGGGILLTYAVEPADSLVLPDHGFARLDGLWRSTCFELFVKTDGQAAYREFNFAPPGAWNAYSFRGWRKGMALIDLADEPHLVDCRINHGRKNLLPRRYELEVVLAPDAIGAEPAKMSLTAVIEETGGTLSYWALAHPPGQLNFHHPACFTAMLPPIADA